MNNDLIVSAELITALILKNVDEFKKYFETYKKELFHNESLDNWYILSRVYKNVIHANQNKTKIEECFTYMMSELGLTGDINSLINKTTMFYEKENSANILEQKLDLIDISNVDINDIMIGSEIERLLNLLINDERYILDNLSMINEYTERLKAIQR